MANNESMIGECRLGARDERSAWLIETVRRTAGWMALAAFGLLGATAPAHAQCSDGAATPTLPMPAWTWLRSWRADFAAPTRLAEDAAGRVLITDPTRGRVVTRNADGSVADVKRDVGNPTAIAADADGRIWVGDGRTGRVTAYDAAWNPLYPLGVGEGEFGQPGDIAIDPANGELYVSDTARHVVAVYSPAGIRQRVIGAPAPTDGDFAAPGLFRTPTGVTIAGNELLVADQLNYRVQAFDKLSGAFLYCIGTYRLTGFFSAQGGPRRTLGMPQGLWVDTLGRLYVTDAYQAQVQVYQRGNGAFIGSISALGTGPGELRVPSDVLIDRSGRLFVASTDNGRLEMYGLDAYTDPERFAPATARASPDRLERAAPPATVEIVLEVPGYPVTAIDPASLRVSGLAATLLTPLAEATDNDGNDVPEVRVAVPGPALLGTLGDGPTTFSVTGTIAPLAFAATATATVIVPPPQDADGDGVLDTADLCPGSQSGEPVDLSGCTLAQICPCEGPGADVAWRNHGAYVSCVTEAVRILRNLGRLAETETGARVSAAATSACGRNR